MLIQRLRRFPLLVLFLFCLPHLACTQGSLEVELVPTIGQNFDDLEVLKFTISGPALQGDPISFEIDYSKGSAELPELVLNPSAQEKWVLVQAQATRINGPATALGVTRFRISSPNINTTLRVLLSRTQRMGWLTSIENGSQQSKMPVGLVGHALTTLKDGRILLSGGVRNFTEKQGILNISTLEKDLYLYDPQTGKVSRGPSMTSPRAFHTATLLKDGRVLIVGGFGFINNQFTPLSYSAIFDPVQNKVREYNTPELKSPRAFHTATALPDGSILFVGGTASMMKLSGSVKDWAGQTVTAVEWYDPTTNSIKPALTLNASQSRFQHRTVALSSTQILTVGGLFIDGSVSSTQQARKAFDNALLFTKKGNTWSMSPLNPPTKSSGRYDHALVTLTRGNDSWGLAVGGRNQSHAPLNTLQLWARNDQLIPVDVKLTTPRYGHTAMVTPDNKLVVMGGVDSNQKPVKTCEVFSISFPGGLPVLKKEPTLDRLMLESKGRYRAQAVMHPHSMRIFLFGGATHDTNGKFNALNSVEFYTPAPASAP